MILSMDTPRLRSAAAACGAAGYPRPARSPAPACPLGAHTGAVRYGAYADAGEHAAEAA